MDTGALVALLAGLLGILAGIALTWLRLHPRITRLREENIRLQARLEAEQRTAEEKYSALLAARNQLNESFGYLAAEALKHNTTEFLKLAQENLQRFQNQAASELDERRKSFETLVRPIREALDKTEQQIRQMEKERREAFGSLTRHLETLTSSEHELRQETQRLVNALRRPEVRGQWGEMTLKRLAELAGMVEHCDFDTQTTVNGDEGRLRPDMVVRLPDRREIVVDAKTPLDAYLAAMEARDDEERRRQLARHARKVRDRIRELADKGYWRQFDHSPEFVVLFVPGDQFLSAALEQAPDLLEEALSRRVILATPTSFVALLRAVAFGWRQEVLAQNAEKVRQLGEELYGRVTVFAEHLAQLGRSLDRSVGAYNKAVGSFEGRVLPNLRRFPDMGIRVKKDIPEPEILEQRTRPVSSDPDAE